MNEKARNTLVAYCESKEWLTSEDDLIEALTEANVIHREEVGQHRWWNEYLYVVDINGMLIGFIWAEANRDESVRDLGWEFDPGTICEMERVEEIVVTYKLVRP